MPTITTKYKIFLASPSDLNDERNSIESVIQELNGTFGVENNIVLELVRWETHSGSGISDTGSTQNVINKDINDEYDIFIGMMWMKFGTPTQSASSGTEEEFIRAFKKYKNNPHQTQILFYFKNATPKNLSDINTTELDKVNKFKEDIVQKGILYGSFQNIQELHESLRKDIRFRIKDLIEKQNNKMNVISINEDENNSEDIDDFGLIDLNEMIEEKFDLCNQSLSKICSSTELLDSQMTENGKELYLGDKSNKKQLKKILRIISDSMNTYSSNLKVESLSYFENYADGLDNTSRLIDIVGDFYDENTIDELFEVHSLIETINDNMKSSLLSLDEFKTVIDSLPRIDVSTNKAKRNVSDSLKMFIERINDSILISDNVMMEIRDKIEVLKLKHS